MAFQYLTIDQVRKLSTVELNSYLSAKYDAEHPGEREALARALANTVPIPEGSVQRFVGGTVLSPVFDTVAAPNPAEELAKLGISPALYTASQKIVGGTPESLASITSAERAALDEQNAKALERIPVAAGGTATPESTARLGEVELYLDEKLEVTAPWVAKVPAELRVKTRAALRRYVTSKNGAADALRDPSLSAWERDAQLKASLVIYGQDKGKLAAPNAPELSEEEWNAAKTLFGQYFSFSPEPKELEPKPLGKIAAAIGKALLNVVTIGSADSIIKGLGLDTIIGGETMGFLDDIQATATKAVSSVSTMKFSDIGSYFNNVQLPTAPQLVTFAAQQAGNLTAAQVEAGLKGSPAAAKPSTPPPTAVLSPLGGVTGVSSAGIIGGLIAAYFLLKGK